MIETHNVRVGSFILLSITVLYPTAILRLGLQGFDLFKLFNSQSSYNILHVLPSQAQTRQFRQYVWLLTLHLVSTKIRLLQK